jgi:hypothetical protein
MIHPQITQITQIRRRGPEKAQKELEQPLYLRLIYF